MEIIEFIDQMSIVSYLARLCIYILGAFEALFIFRLIFKLLGANPGSTFVSLIYELSGNF